MKDVYENFASDYDEFGLFKWSANEKQFFDSLFKENNVHTVLDCACGTGQHLLMFSEMGLDVTGSDYSRAMLREAKTNLETHQKEIHLSQCDFRYLEQKHEDKFDAVVCLTTALPHLHTDEDLITALKSMKSRLNKNGLLVLTQGTTHFNLTLPSIQVLINREDFSQIFVIENEASFQTIHILDLYHSNSRTESNQYDIVYRILLDDDYKRLLSEAGFQNISIWGDYKKTDYTKESRRLIVVAK